MIITEVRIRNYKAFDREVKVEFKTPFTLLVGKNSSGKSTILDAIAKVFWARNRDLIERDEKNNQFDESFIEIKAKYYKKKISDAGVQGSIPDEEIRVYKIRSSKGVWEPALARDKGEGNEPDFVRIIRNISRYNPEREISEKLSEIFGKNVEIKYDKASKAVKVLIEGKELEPQSLSAGMQAILAIESILYFKERANHLVFLIEEVENFLHPNLLRKYVSQLRETANSQKNKFQVIVTSHSKIIPSMVSPKEVIKVDSEGIFRFDEDMEDWEYIMDENKSDLFFSDRVIFFEGITDKAIFSGILKSMKVNPADYNTSLIHIEGVYYKEKLEKLCKAFNVNCIFILDKDAKEREENFENKIFLENGEIEDNIPVEDWAKITYVSYKQGNFKVPLWFLINVLDVGTKFEKFSDAVVRTFHRRKLDYAVKLQKLYENGKPKEKHPLYNIVEGIKAFIEYGVIKTDIKQTTYNPVEILKEASCIYLLEENTLSNPEIFVNELNNEEEGIFCFIFNDKCYGELNKVIDKFLKETIPFYCIVGDRWNYERAKKKFGIDMYVEKEEQNLLTLMSNGVRSFIVKPQRTLSKKDLEFLIDCKPVL